MLPQGLRNSHFAKIRPGPGQRRSKARSGVLPTRSKTLEAISVLIMQMKYEIKNGIFLRNLQNKRDKREQSLEFWELLNILGGRGLDEFNLMDGSRQESSPTWAFI